MVVTLMIDRSQYPTKIIKPSVEIVIVMIALAKYWMNVCLNYNGFAIVAIAVARREVQGLGGICLGRQF